MVCCGREIARVSVHRGFSDEVYNDNSKSREECGVWKLFKRRLKTNPGVFKTQFFSFSVGKHLLVAYWGQNSAGIAFPQNPEKDLKDVCAERKYDIIVIGFVVTFFGQNNKGTYQ